MRRRADPRLDKAGWVHCQLNPFETRCDLHFASREDRGPIAGTLGKNRKPYSEMTTFGARFLLSCAEFRDIDQRRRFFHRLAVTTTVMHQPSRRGVRKLRDQIAAAYFQRIDAEAS